MRFFILFLLLSIQGQSFAQRKLKYDIIKESGDTIFYTADERLYVSAGDSYGSGRDKRSTVGDYLKSTVLKYPSGFALEFSIQTGRSNSFSIYPEHTATIMLTDGSTVTLKSRGNYTSKKSSMGYGCWMFAFYTLPAPAMEKLRSSTVSAIRLESSMGTFDYPLKAKFGAIISEQVKSF